MNELDSHLFDWRLAALRDLPPGTGSVDACGMLLSWLVPKREPWTLPAVVALLDGTYGQVVRDSAWTSAFEGCHSNVLSTSFASLCIRTLRIDVLRAALLVPAPTAFAGLVNEATQATTVKGRLLDRMTWRRLNARNHSVATFAKSTFLETLLRELLPFPLPQEVNDFISLAISADPHHPCIEQLRTTSFGPLLIEASMKQRISSAQVDPDIAPSAAPSARRARAGL